MAVKYLRSAATGAGTGADWTNAYTTLAAALAGVAAGDSIYVADDHAETQASVMTLTSPGTASAPVQVLCVATHSVTPPTALATSATVSTTGASNLNLAAGYAYIYGITFVAGNSTNAANIQLGNSNNINAHWHLESCALQLGGSSAASLIVLGNDIAANVANNSRIKLVNTTLQFSSASQSARLNAGDIEWTSTAGAITGATVPTTLFSTLAGRSHGNLLLSGVDLSAAGSGKNLFAISTAGYGKFYLRNCKLGASVTVLSGTIPGTSGPFIFLENCDSGSGNYRMEHYRYQGTVKHETVKVRSSGGASDGTTALSHNFTALATGPSLFSPLEGPWMTTWNDTSGSSKTVTVEICTENVALYNNECWLEVEYLGTSGFPQGVYVNSRVADVFTTHALLTTSAASWSGFSTPAPQSLAVTFTPALKGPIRARVCVAKPSAVVYVDPIVKVT